jgi:hypothetical protein
VALENTGGNEHCFDRDYQTKEPLMDISLQKTSALVVMLGSVLFLIAAFLPISFRVFPEPSAARKLDALTSSPTAWFAAQIFFGLGALVTVLGVGLAAYGFRAQPFGGLAQASVAVLTLGTLLWVWHLGERTVDPAAFANGALSVWPLLLYFGLTEAGLALFGVALLGSGLPAWLGWVVIGSMALFFAIVVIFRDIPPFVFYAITLLVGIVLYGRGVG